MRSEKTRPSKNAYTLMLDTLNWPGGGVAVNRNEEREMAPSRTIRQVESMAETLLILEYMVCMLTV